MKSLFLAADSYLDRNWRWLCPMFAALILRLAPEFLAQMPGVELPDWLVFASHVGAFVGILLWGIFTALTDTLSAKVMRFAAWGALAVVVVNWLSKFFAG